jgi:3D (Asp-Asp-Asp) domain-containing protein
VAEQIQRGKDPEAEYKLPLPCQPPADRIKDDPLEGYIAFIRAGKSTETRDWVLPLLVKGLDIPVRVAHITGYSSRDSDGGGTCTRWETRTRWGICAADPAYWGPGTVIWMGDPVNQVLVVEDTGSAIKGKDRFDICVGDDPASSERLGSRHANYVPLYAAAPRRNWGDKPDDWRPPLPKG